jgi:hypothetical protein
MSSNYRGINTSEKEEGLAMKAMSPITLGLCMFSVLVCMTVAFGASIGPAVNLDQCSNGPLAAPVACTGTAWVNGNLNESLAHYFEGESLPYRLRFDNLNIASVIHTVRIEWDTTQLEAANARHALDYLTSFNQTETDADPCSGVLGCSLAVSTTLAIQPDPMVALGPDGTGGTADDIVQIPGVFTLFGGTLQSISGYTVSGSYDGTSSTSVTVSLTAAVANPVLAWGGHIAARVDWAPESTALHIPGLVQVCFGEVSVIATSVPRRDVLGQCRKRHCHLC